MRLGWRAHGAARIAAGLGTDPRLPPDFPDAVREQLAKAEVSEEEAHLAWELARLARLPEDEHVALTVLILLTQEALARGSTRLPIADRAALVERARALGADEPTATLASALLDRAPPDLFGPDRPLVIDGEHLYHQRLRAVEERLARRIAARLATARGATDAGSVDAGAALEALRARPAVTAAGPVVLTDEQEDAVRAALEQPFAVITGGPGTGKTSIVVAILRAAVAAADVDPASIALAAPTGKAADRMRQAIEAALAAVADPSPNDARLTAALPTPRTLHRLLGYAPSRGGFRHHADNPLSERLVIVDESSMIDVFLMERLVESLHPRARLVLLGDADQLPSVAAGAVFRDLGASARVPAVKLERSHRMDPTRPEGFNVLSVANQINAGQMPAVGDARVEHDLRLPADPRGIARLDALPEADPLGGVHLLAPSNPAARDAFLAAWYARHLTAPRDVVTRTWPRVDGRIADDAVAALFAHAERARLLCVTRSAARPTGVDAVNAALHHLHAEALGVPAPPGRLLAGEPLLVARNDYERGLFNGDQGLALWTRGEDDAAPRLSAVFRREDGFAAHPIEAVRPSIDLGFATTVHKAQGSEHDAVALLLPETDSPRLMTREIVYTAITRARRTVVVVGAPALLERAVRRRIERSSGVAERIGETSRDGG